MISSICVPVLYGVADIFHPCLSHFHMRGVLTYRRDIYGHVIGSSKMRTEDGYIVRECLNGDSASFGLLVDKYKESIYALAYSRLHNFHDAEDVTQDAFLKAYENIQTLKRWDSFLVWLRSITINLCRDRIRKRVRSLDGEFIEDQEPGIVEEKSVEFYQDEQSSISHEETLSFLDKALGLLPEAYQQVLTLHYLGGMSDEKISQFLGISRANVRQRLSRARRQLRAEMLVTMNSIYEQRRLPVGFTFRIVEAAKRIKINPMPRMAGLPWGLSLTIGIIVTVLGLNPHLSLPNPTTAPTGSTLPRETEITEVGEIPVDILEVSQTPFITSRQGDEGAGETELADAYNTAPMAAPGKGDTWAKKADMPTRREGLSSSAVNQKIYAIGGRGPSGGFENQPILSSVEEYNPAMDTWTEKVNMPTARCFLSTSVVDGKIYAIGGDDGTQAFAVVEEYDPVKDKWTKKADMLAERTWARTSVVDGKIYAIGGLGWRGGASLVALPEVEEYDPLTDTWAKKADMPTARYGFDTSMVNGRIYAIGGRTVDRHQILSTVEEYDPLTDTWIEKTDMPTARAYLSTSAVNGKIYAVGGIETDDWWRWPPVPESVLATVEEYDPLMDTWTRKNNMPTARLYLCSSAVNGKIYAIGGLDSTAKIILPTVEEYDTGLAGEWVEATGKFLTKWGEVKSD